MKKNTTETVNDRIKALIERSGNTVNSFAKTLGHSGNGTIQRIVVGIDGRKAQPGYETLMEIITTFNVNPTWLMLGRGEMFFQQSDKEVAAPGEVNYLKMYNEAQETVAVLRRALDNALAQVKELKAKESKLSHG